MLFPRHVVLSVDRAAAYRCMRGMRKPLPLAASPFIYKPKRTFISDCRVIESSCQHKTVDLPPRPSCLTEKKEAVRQVPPCSQLTNDRRKQHHHQTKNETGSFPGVCMHYYVAARRHHALVIYRRNQLLTASYLTAVVRTNGFTKKKKTSSAVVRFWYT